MWAPYLLLSLPIAVLAHAAWSAARLAPAASTSAR
jgi:hypothetical protein